MDCDVIRDLIPLVKEGMASSKSESLVKEHIETCAACKNFYDAIDQPIDDIEESPDRPLGFLAKSLDKDRKLYGLMIGSLLISIFLIITSILTYPREVNYSSDLIDMELKDNIYTINFSDEVTRVYKEYSDYDGQKILWLNGSYTYLDKLLGDRDMGVTFSTDEIDIAMYNNNGDEFAKVLYDKDRYFANGGGSSLARLSLSLYASLMVGITIVVAILMLTIFRKKSTYTKIRFITLPLSYVLATFLIKGCNLASFHLQRDLAYILLTSLAIYLFFLSISVYLERKEKFKLSL